MKFVIRNLKLICYPNWQTVSAKLSWSHYVELIGIKDDLERNFYEKQSSKENWGVRELQRQKNSLRNQLRITN